MKTNLLTEAAEWRLISLLFECPGQEWQTQVAGLAKEVADPQLKTAAKAARQQASESLYHSTFGPGGPAAPREVSHRQSLMPGQMLEDIGAFYEAFAYVPATTEPRDHVAVMTGFVAYLRLKEAFGNSEQTEIAAVAAKRFLDEHLNTLAEPLAKSLAHSEITYLATAAAALLKRVGPCRTTAAPVPVEDCAGCRFAEEEDNL